MSAFDRSMGLGEWPTPTHVAAKKHSILIGSRGDSKVSGSMDGIKAGGNTNYI